MTEDVKTSPPPAAAAVVDATSPPAPTTEEEEQPPPKETTTEESKVEEEEGGFLFHLCILPPLQRGKTASTDGLIRLPPIRAEEPVSSLRAALGEVRGLAHITQYRLTLDHDNAGCAEREASATKDTTPSVAAPVVPATAHPTNNGTPNNNNNTSNNGGGGKKGKKKKKGQAKQAPQQSSNSNGTTVAVPTTDVTSSAHTLASPFTGPEAVVTVQGGNGASDDDEIVLDDYGDLSTLGLRDGAAFRMVLERYDAAAVRDHVTRLRALFDGNAPCVDTLFEETQVEETAADVAPPQEEETPPDDTPEGRARQLKLREQARAAHRKSLAETMPDFPLDQPVAVDGSDIARYYHASCGEELSHDHEDADDVRLNALDTVTVVPCSIRWSGFHPPPARRALLAGDLAYLEVSICKVVTHVTVTPLGFYVNRTTNGNLSHSPYRFDPSPADDPCFSHELLDCLLQRSKSLRTAWDKALTAAKERADISATAAGKDSPIQALHRVAVRGCIAGSSQRGNGGAGNGGGIDSIILRPSWTVPQQPFATWNRNDSHTYSIARAEEDLTMTHGLDIRGGALRDWNEELQSAREMPTADLNSRIDRARMVHKVLSDFGEASLLGAMAIFQGHVTPMNPNEATRSHVYLHNNIFFSRALDAGVDTFKVSRGDEAARKSASRDAQCMGSLHRLDVPGLHTLATVLVDYMGTRLVCQSIVPGILHGEKTHTLLYGAVEATAPLIWDEGMHELLEGVIGKGLMVASRKVPTYPLSEERTEMIRTLKGDEPEEQKKDETGKTEDATSTTLICGPVEAKGIKGSDQRTYVLDLTRLTPRDANWVSKKEGGTGNWEKELDRINTKSQKHISNTVSDDEWTMAVLRPELITHLTHQEMSEYLTKKKKSVEAVMNGDADKQSGVEHNNSDPAATEDKQELPAKTDNLSDKLPVKVKSDKPVNLSKVDVKPEDEQYLHSLRYNLNVLLPNTKSLEDVGDTSGQEVHNADEKRVRAAANHLWNTVLPTLTKEMRENSNFSAHQIPVDGASLTETLHLRGVNCRYLGRLAQLAQMEEQKDIENEQKIMASGKLGTGKKDLLPRKTMPLCWLELLECEIVARAAKHVLDRYLTENGSAAATMPSQTVASFLSSLLSTREETAAETESRIGVTDNSIPTDDELNALTVTYGGGGGNGVPCQIRGRTEIWNDVEAEVGRRFRYTPTLYNKSSSILSSTVTKGKDSTALTSSSSRALFTPLLRRVCQRTGIRITAKKYDLGGMCLCSSASSAGVTITASYPISPVDIIDIVPMVKHAASHGGEGFVPCSTAGSAVVTLSSSLHILLSDAKATFEAAHVHWSARSLPRALDLAQEAASMYQRVVDTPLHASVSRCLDLTAVILFQAQEPELAAANASRALAVAVQLGGFDCAEALTAHTTLAHILISSGGLAGGVKHLRASLYLMELLAGPHYAELVNVYHKLGTMYHEMGNGIHALRFYQEAAQRQVSDRMVEGMISKSSALVLAGLGQFKAALDSERRTYSIYRLILGEDHDLTVTSANTLKQFMKLAVEQGTRLMEEEKKRLQVEAAEAIANKIESDEVKEEEKKKKKKKKKSRKKA